MTKKKRTRKQRDDDDEGDEEEPVVTEENDVLRDIRLPKRSNLDSDRPIVEILVKKEENEEFEEIDTEQLDITGKQPLENQQNSTKDANYEQHILLEAKPEYLFAIRLHNYTNDSEYAKVTVDGNPARHSTTEDGYFVNANSSTLIEGFEDGELIRPFIFAKAQIAQDVDELRENRLKVMTDKFAHLSRIIITFHKTTFHGLETNTNNNAGKRRGEIKVDIIKENDSKLFGVTTKTAGVKPNNFLVKSRNVNVYSTEETPFRTICVTYRDILGMHFTKKRYGIPIVRNPRVKIDLTPIDLTDGENAPIVNNAAEEARKKRMADIESKSHYNVSFHSLMFCSLDSR
jgi:hypothetical protein